MGIEVLIVVVLALILIPPDKLPETAGFVAGIFRDIKSATDSALHEVSDILDATGLHTGDAGKDAEGKNPPAKNPEVVDIGELLLRAKAAPADSSPTAPTTSSDTGATCRQ
jgi:Sec-independent protein translocase protein TatA